MSISEDLLHVNAALGTMAETLSGENYALLQMISVNLHALAEQVEALEGVPLEMGATRSAGVSLKERLGRITWTTGVPPQ